MNDGKAELILKTLVEKSNQFLDSINADQSQLDIASNFHKHKLDFECVIAYAEQELNK